VKAALVFTRSLHYAKRRETSSLLFLSNTPVRTQTIGKIRRGGEGRLLRRVFNGFDPRHRTQYRTPPPCGPDVRVTMMQTFLVCYTRVLLDRGRSSRFGLGPSVPVNAQTHTAVCQTPWNARYVGDAQCAQTRLLKASCPSVFSVTSHPSGAIQHLEAEAVPPLCRRSVELGVVHQAERAPGETDVSAAAASLSLSACLVIGSKRHHHPIMCSRGPRRHKHIYIIFFRQQKATLFILGQETSRHLTTTGSI